MEAAPRGDAAHTWSATDTWNCKSLPMPGGKVAMMVVWSAVSDQLVGVYAAGPLPPPGPNRTHSTKLGWPFGSFAPTPVTEAEGPKKSPMRYTTLPPTSEAPLSRRGLPVGSLDTAAI